MRKDIQGLRAVAVLAVLLFHFWPDRLPGGYVGVDIFFVISGFLITQHLLKNPPTTLKKLSNFWAKRIRRLIPAATLVLLATIAASVVFLPETMIQGTARESIASAIYGQNWMLASTATDYLRSQDAPSPVQHYWSLSIEEQFYAVWPILIGSLFIFGKRFLSAKKRIALALSSIFFVSLAWSVHLTETDPASAYFVTTTRVWELGLGGLVALISITKWWIPSGKARVLLSWIGLLGVSTAILIFTSDTPFPGYTALLPTFGTGLILLAAIDSIKWSPRKLLSWKPNQFFGDISYSIYLWHWPAVVLAPYALGKGLTWKHKLILIIAVLVLAALTKRFVEDPIRDSKILKKSVKRTFIYGFASILVVIGVSAGMAQMSATKSEEASVRLQQALARDDECIGAGALRHTNCTIEGSSLLMSPSFAKQDKSVVYKDGCWANRHFSDRKVCTYGNKDSTVRIALIGNSHAGMWQAAIEKVTTEKNWRLDTYLASECYTVMAPLEFKAEGLSANCMSWNKWAVGSIVDGDYDATIMADLTGLPITGVPDKEKNSVAQAEYKKTIETITSGGGKVLAIHDAPAGGRNVPNCLALNAKNPEKCNNIRNNVIALDPLHEAANQMNSESVSTLDLNNLMCSDDTCFVIIGGLIVYFDEGHLTNSFVRTLQPEISEALVGLVEE